VSAAAGTACPCRKSNPTRTRGRLAAIWQSTLVMPLESALGNAAGGVLPMGAQCRVSGNMERRAKRLMPCETYIFCKASNRSIWTGEQSCFRGYGIASIAATLRISRQLSLAKVASNSRSELSSGVFSMLA
jgi:hypothetical protein